MSPPQTEAEELAQMAKRLRTSVTGGGSQTFDRRPRRVEATPTDGANGMSMDKGPVQ